MFIPGTMIYVWYWAYSHGWGSQKKYLIRKGMYMSRLGFYNIYLIWMT
jgi:hypothetical protein